MARAPSKTGSPVVLVKSARTMVSFSVSFAADAERCQKKKAATRTVAGELREARTRPCWRTWGSGGGRRGSVDDALDETERRSRIRQRSSSWRVAPGAARVGSTSGQRTAGVGVALEALKVAANIGGVLVAEGGILFEGLLMMRSSSKGNIGIEANGRDGGAVQNAVEDLGRKCCRRKGKVPVPIS